MVNNSEIFAGRGLAMPRIGNAQLRLHLLRLENSGMIYINPNIIQEKMKIIYSISKPVFLTLLFLILIISKSNGQSKVTRHFLLSETSDLSTKTNDSIIINKVKILFLSQTAMTDVIYLKDDFLNSLFKEKAPFRLIELKGGDLPVNMTAYRVKFDSCMIRKNKINFSQFHSDIEFYTYIDICYFDDYVIVVDDNLRVFRISGFSHNDISYLIEYQDVKLFKSKFLRISDSIVIPVSGKCHNQKY